MRRRDLGELRVVDSIEISLKNRPNSLMSKLEKTKITLENYLTKSLSWDAGLVRTRYHRRMRVCGWGV